MPLVLLDSVCSWLYINAENYLYGYNGEYPPYSSIATEEMIKDLRSKFGVEDE